MRPRCSWPSSAGCTRRASRSGACSRSTATAATTSARSRPTTPPSFNCRAATGSTRWSNHAYGRAIDVNPIENPYVSGGTTSHSASRPYLDRSRHRPRDGICRRRARRGVPRPLGWGWGGSWCGRSGTTSTSRATGGRVAGVLKGALAASVTPLARGGAALDEDGFGPLADFLAAGGLDGLLALGTNGEGILLSVAERKRAAELFLEAAAGRLQVAVHAGAQSTADTAALAAHAAEIGADAVAVIAPPYFALDEASQLEHFAAAATPCAPLPFYVYEFAITSGYAVPPAVVERLRERAAEPRGDEGLRPHVGAARAVPDRRARRLRRLRGADRAGDGRRRGRSGFGAGVRVSGGRHRRRPGRGRRSRRAACARSTASRDTRRSSTFSSGAACRSARTSGRRSGG